MELRTYDQAEKYEGCHRGMLAQKFDEGIVKGKAEGIAEGIVRGKAEGIAEGIVKGKAEAAQEVLNALIKTMYQKNIEISSIIAITGLPKEEIEALILADSAALPLHTHRD